MKSDSGSRLEGLCPSCMSLLWMMGAIYPEVPGNLCADLLGEMEVGVPVPTWMSSGRPSKHCCMGPLRSRS
eukprot:1250267-Prorocentrum_lima.AAC.1